MAPSLDDLVQVEPLSESPSSAIATVLSPRGTSASILRHSAPFQSIPVNLVIPPPSSRPTHSSSPALPSDTNNSDSSSNNNNNNSNNNSNNSVTCSIIIGEKGEEMQVGMVGEEAVGGILARIAVGLVGSREAARELQLWRGKSAVPDDEMMEPDALQGVSLRLAGGAWPALAPEGTPTGAGTAADSPTPPPSPSPTTLTTSSGTASRPKGPAIGANFFIKGDNSWERVTDAQGDAPEPRAYASAVVTPDCSSLFLFGGATLKGKGAAGDVFELKTASRKWLRHKAVSKQGPPKLTAQTAVGTATGMVVFGGSSDATSGMIGKLQALKGVSYLNDSYFFDFASKEWSKMKAAVQGPPKRGSAAGALGQDGGVYIFGGRDGKTVLDDAWKLDLASQTWARRAAGPAARHSHTLTAVNGGASLILFGGTNDGEVLGDMWQYNVENNSWTQLEIDTRFARKNHSTVHYRGSLFIFGGEDARGVPSPLLLEFDLTSRMWSIVETRASSTTNASLHLPHARFGHAAVVDPSSEVFWIFGGSTGPNDDESGDLFEFTFEDKGFRATLDKMLSNTSTADVVFKTNDSAEVRAHKCIVYARSPALLGDLAEDGDSSVAVDLSRAEVKCILKFVYTETFDPSELTLESLLKVIAYMQDKSPARFAALGEHRAQRLIDDATVGPAVNTAVALKLDNMKHYCLRYIVEHAATVLEREEMKTVDNQLLLEVISYTSGNKEPPAVQPIRVDAKTLSKDLARLVSDKRFADMTVVVKEKPSLEGDTVAPVETVSLHRCIMVERAAWFKEHAPAAGCSIDEPLGLSPDVFRSFTSFLYTDVVDFPTTHAMHLLYAAAKYGVTEPRLRRVCDKLVRLRPAREQLLFGLEVADELQDGALRAYILKAIVSFFGYVGRHKYLDSFESKPELLTEILQTLAEALAERGGPVRSDASLGIRAGVANASDLVRPENVWMGPLPTKGDPLAARARHCAVIADAEGGRGAPTLYCVGGVGAAKQTFSGDLYSLGLEWIQEGEERGTWKKLSTKGKAEARWGASLVHYRPHNTLWLFGGSSSFAKSTPTNDLFEYNIGEASWRKVKPGNGSVAPSSRLNHAAVVVEGTMFVVGGSDGKGAFTADLHSFRIATPTADDTHVWNKLGSADALARANHTVVYYAGCLIVYGGEGEKDQLLDDVLKYSFAKNTWTRMKVGGLAPPARSGHSATVCGNSMYVFGGVTPYGPSTELYQLNFATKTWLLVDTSEGPSVPPRYDHAAAFYEGSVFVHGGMVSQSASGAMEPADSLYELSFGEGGYRQRMREMLDKGVLADVAFTVAGEVPAGAQPLRAHKPILAARAPTLLEELEPAGATYRAMWALLVAVYTDQVDLAGLELEDLFPMLRLAQKHQLERLAVLTERRIWALLNPDNVGAAINLAVATGQDNVKNYCVRFIWQNQKEVLDRDTLSVLDSKLLLEIMRFTRADIDESALPKVVAPAIPRQSLREDVGRLAFSELASDAVLLCSDGGRVPVHRCLLSVRSRYFADKFTGGEGSAPDVEIAEFLKAPRDVVDSFLKFVYADVVDFPPEHAVTLLEMAKVYQLTSKRLFEACSKVVRIGLKQEDVLKAMEVADRIEDSELKEFLVQRIVAQFSGVGQSDKVKELHRNPRLITDVLRALAISMS